MKLLLALVLVFSFEAHAQKCGKISSVKGKAEVLRMQKGGNRHAMKAKKRMKLQCSDVFVTHAAARAKLRLDKAILTVGPNSYIEIEKRAKGAKSQDVNLSFGKVRAVFKGKQKENQASRFNVKTPAAIAGVRGTDFYVTYKPNEKITEQATIEGKVEVIQKETGQKALVEKGKQVKVENIQAKIEEKVKAEKAKLEAEKAKRLAEIEKAKLDEKAKKKALAEAEAKAAAELAAKQAAVAAAVKAAAKPVLVASLDKNVATEIRQTSSLVKDDEDFTSKEAVEVLGDPETWKPPKDEELPSRYRDVKNEF